MRELLALDFPADTRELHSFRECVRELCISVGIGPRDADLVTTAAWEAALNATTHGSPRGRLDRVAIRIFRRPRSLTISVSSRAPGFELPVRAPSAHPMSNRGRGLHLIYAFMDKVWLTRDSDGVTLHMLKRLDGRGEAN